MTRPDPARTAASESPQGAGKSCLLPGRERVLDLARGALDRGGLVKTESLAAEDAPHRVLAGPVCAVAGGDVLFAAGHRLTPEDTGTLLLAGVRRVRVHERVRLAYVPTGDEVLDFRDRPVPGPGQVVESNSMVFASLARQWGAETACVSPVPDDPDALLGAVQKLLHLPDAQRPHLIVLCAGSARGTRDYSREVFERLGSMLADGIAMVPGKSAKLAVASGRLLVNAPGRPPGALTVFEQIVAPLAAWLGHCPQPRPGGVRARLVKTVTARTGLERLVRMGLAEGADGELLAVPLDRGHQGMFGALSNTQGLLRMRPDVASVGRGDMVEVERLENAFPAQRTILCAAEPDPLVDRLADAFMALDPSVRLLVRGEAGKDARASVVRVREDLHQTSAQGIVVGSRRTGLLVAPGNPLGIADAVRAEAEGAQVVNLFDGCANRLADVVALAGEQATELGIAACVGANLADCGPGSEDAAKRMGLGFVPLGVERMEFVCARDDEPVREAAARAVKILTAGEE